MNEFKDILKYLRQRDKLTQQEFADKVGLSRSRINNYEQGVREPDFETLELIADFFNVSIGFLLGQTNEDGLTAEEVRMLNIIKQIPNIDNVATIRILYEDGHEEQVQLFRA